MRKAEELRNKAAHVRRLAGIRTEGGQAADRRLIELAYKLEREAESLEPKRRDTPRG